MSGAESRFKMVKAHHKMKLQEAIEKKKIDPLMIELANSIAKTKNYFSTSSCSGRIILLQLNDDEDKEPCAFFRKWHSPVKSEDIWEALHEKSEKNIWFKQEPFVLVVGTHSFEHAKVIIEICKDLGIKRCGISFFKDGKVLMEIFGSQGMSFMAKKKNELLVERKFIDEQVKIANSKWKKNDDQLKELQAKLIKELK